MRLTGKIAVSALVCVGLVHGAALAQDAPADATDADAPAAESSDVPKAKRPFSLYVAIAAGTADADDIDSSIETSAVSKATSLLSLDDQTYGRAELGWKFQNNKGTARVIWNGFREEEFTLTGSGDQAVIDLAASGTTTQPNVVGRARWWTYTIANGVSTMTRNSPIWNSSLDANGDNAAQLSEIQYDPMNAFTIVSSAPENLQNRLQTIDLVYGREFGSRRFGSRWFAGLRYHNLEGTVPATAWLLGGDATPGVGFTEGSAINPITMYNTSTGIGPTGSMSWDVKFFEERTRLFVRGQAAFSVASIDVDAAPFLTLVINSGGFYETVDADLREERSKSVWSNELEIGFSHQFKNGIGLHASYTILGMLDAYLLPTNLRIPTTEVEAGQGVSAVYNTQDYVLNTARAGISFQF